MFFNCLSLKTVDLFDTGKVTNFTTMFSTCRALTSIPLFNTSFGTNFTSMFASCNALTEIPLLNTASASNMTGIFNGAQSIIYLPALNTANVTTLNQAFNNCSNLRELPALNLPLCTVFTTWLTTTALSKSLVYGATRGHSYSGMSLSQANIVTIFTNLGTASGAQTINVSSNPGRAALTAPEIAIATGKGWSVV
jgi:surface protein